ncbi:MAG: hypothetical protein Q7S70_00695 [bacterium]|nr:hypothetical protein [bacterium]
MAQVQARTFKKFINGVTASVVLLNKGRQQILEIGENGVLTIPVGVTPNAFSLLLHTEETRVVFAQKNVGEDKGGYNDLFPEGIVEGQIFSPPIQVMRAGENVWTSWHQEKTNRMDCWLVGIEGCLELFQIGVITHDDGQTFRLLGESRWQGQIFRDPASDELVAKPDKPKWGPLGWNPGESRAGIRENPDFQDLLANAAIPIWEGTPEELNPPLSPIPDGTFARIDWYVPFAGQKGQGIAKDQKGNSYWIHGQDVAVPPDADGIRRLYHNDLISYILVHQNWGTKTGPAKLLGVKKV